MATINGTNGGDSLYGTAAADIISGLNGNDTLKGFGGADRLDGGAGIDTVFYGDSTAGDVVAVAAVEEVGAGGPGEVERRRTGDRAAAAHRGRSPRNARRAARLAPIGIRVS